MVQSRLVAFLVIRILALKPIKTAFNRAEITNGWQKKLYVIGVSLLRHCCTRVCIGYVCGRLACPACRG